MVLLYIVLSYPYIFQIDQIKILTLISLLYFINMTRIILVVEMSSYFSGFHVWDCYAVFFKQKMHIEVGSASLQGT